MRRIFLSLACAALLGGGAALAGPGPARVVEGTEAEKHVSDLTSKIAWQRSLDAAEKLAKRDGKLILWVHVKGDLDGAT